MPRTYDIRKKQDRAAMAARLAGHLARVDGVTVAVKGEGDCLRERTVEVTVSAQGVQAAFDICGESNWGVFPSWNFDYRTREGRLFSTGFQALVGDVAAYRPHHKATGPHMARETGARVFTEAQADVFAAIINRAMRKVLDGSAFVQEKAPA